MGGSLADKIADFWYAHRDSFISTCVPGGAAQVRARTEPRTVRLNEDNAGRGFCNNYISTTKYHALTFIPVCLFDQLTRVANFYFLVVGILSAFPSITPFGQSGRFSTLATLAFVVSVSMVKEAIEDFRRYRSDSELNDKPTEVLRGGAFVKARWAEVAIGDVVRVRSEEGVPADLVLLSSSGPQGTCYIETANLDGETNLKVKKAVRETAPLAENLAAFRGEMECEAPGNRLYAFSGTLALAGAQKLPVNVDSMLWRGCRVRNTAWACGACVYTGHDTRIMMNAQRKKAKVSGVEHAMNRQMVLIFCVLAGMSVFCAVANYIFLDRDSGAMWYLERPERIGASSALRFLTFVVLFSQIVPISLYVSVEIVKVTQALFINWDERMYDGESGKYAAARTSNINEELGQIEYVFTDKTGTLTRNVMQFRRCSVAGALYGEAPPGPGQGPKIVTVEGAAGSDPEAFEDAQMRGELAGGGPRGEALRAFLTALAVCHTALVEGDPSRPRGLRYQAASPDEEALVKGARDCGFVFRARGPTSIDIDAAGRPEHYEILQVLEFNSDRKRMSVIYRCPDGRVRLFCKGADSKIFPRLRAGDPGVAATASHLERFARDGLRTLVFAGAELGPEEYGRWRAVYEEAALALDAREAKIDAAAELIEKELTLLGASAIEDRLQEGVPETLVALGKAGVKVWVLTGDMQETAINIGMSSGVLAPDFNMLLLNDPAKCVDACSGFSAADASRPSAVVIDGATLGHVLESEGAQAAFLRVARTCATVICCRVSPLQKAQVVMMVRRAEGAVTLAIGDGANDVSMIQAAHVGVGISGKEGMQATLASDFSISQFRFLKRLLLLHGRWSYKRVTKLILYCFYKNVQICFVYFWWSIACGFSGQTLFDGWTSALYNVAFTSVPVLVMATQDRDSSGVALLNRPELYAAGVRGTGFNLRVFWSWVLESVVHSTVVFYLTMAMVGGQRANGTDLGLWAASTATYTVLILTVTGKLCIATTTFSPLFVFIVFFSVLFYFMFLLAYCTWTLYPLGPDMYNVSYVLFESPVFWLAIAVVPVVCLLPTFAWRYVQRQFLTAHKVEVEKAVRREIKLRGLPRRAQSLVLAGAPHTGFAYADQPGHAGYDVAAGGASAPGAGGTSMGPLQGPVAVHFR